MIKWVNFLHIYQPPYQEQEVVMKVGQESYWYLVEMIKKNSTAKITLNFSGCLLEHLYNIGENKLIDAFKELIKDGQIELVGSARYHPILPLLPEAEIKRQITLNDQILKQAFGEYYKPNGFFLPEMAYDFKTAKIIKELGYKWIILDEIAYKGELDLIDYNKKYKISGLDLLVVFRNRTISNTFVPESIMELTQKSHPPTFVVSATDGEMYGHHHQDHKHLFKQALISPQIKTITVSEYLDSLPKEAIEVSPLASSWESKPAELKHKVPFALWNDPKNKIHQNLWELRKLAIKVINQKHEPGINYDWARHHLDRGLSSCSWWWASNKKLGAFDFLAWNPDTIEKGIKELITSIRSLPTVSSNTKLEAEKIYHLLIKEIWKKHWKKYHKTQQGENKMPKEIKFGLSLFNQNILIKLFEKKLPAAITQNSKIDYIAIKPFKKKLGKSSFYHIVCRYRLHFKNQEMAPVTIFCNANSRESRQGAFWALKHVWQNGFNQGQFLCPQPLFYHKQFKAMFYIEASGENLYQYIIKSEIDLAKINHIISLTGQFLARLHQLPTDGVKNFNAIQSRIATIIPGPKKFLAAINEKHKDYPQFYQITKELFDKINSLEKKLNTKKKYLIHGDIHPENVVYSQERDALYIIDYTDCCLSHFTRDLGSFVQQFGYMSTNHLAAEQIREAQQLFIKSYLEARGMTELSLEDKNRFELYKAWTALRSAIFFLTVTMFDRPRADALFEETQGYLKNITIK